MRFYYKNQQHLLLELCNARLPQLLSNLMRSAWPTLRRKYSSGGVQQKFQFDNFC